MLAVIERAFNQLSGQSQLTLWMGLTVPRKPCAESRPQTAPSGRLHAVDGCRLGGQPSYALQPGIDPAPIDGTSSCDLLVCGGGAEVDRGRGGKDTLLGRGGRDRLEGGCGNDVVRGNGDDDVLPGATAPTGSGTSTPTSTASASRGWPPRVEQPEQPEVADP